MSQSESIKEHLERGRSINPIQALNKFGCFRLGARIYDIKAEYGLNISSVRTTQKGKSFATYRLVSS